MIMFQRIALHLCLLGLALVCAGCSELWGKEPDGLYRTITVEPGRNTELARKANQEGLAHLEAGELEAARTAFRKSLTADIEFGPAHNNLGKVLYAQQKWYEAAWEFEYARKLMAKHPAPPNNLGLVLERAGELDRAVECYRGAVALAPDNVAYRANLVRGLIRRGDRTDEVVKLLRTLVKTDDRPTWRRWAEKQLATMGEPID